MLWAEAIRITFSKLRGTLEISVSSFYNNKSAAFADSLDMNQIHCVKPGGGENLAAHNDCGSRNAFEGAQEDKELGPAYSNDHH